MNPLQALATLVFAATGAAQATHWESPHVHPLDATPDGQLLLAVNTADHHLEVFSLATGVPTAAFSIPVGLEPVSVRALSNTEAWVVNRISDSISVVDLKTRLVTATWTVDDEPADVVFARAAEKAYVSCSQANTVLVFDLARREAPPLRIAIDGESPRALAVSPDGQSVYVAIFESGNRSTILGGGALFNIDFPPNVVSSKFSPYAGRNPPPNAEVEGGFRPALASPKSKPPAVGLIVKQDAAGAWRDDFTGDWTHLVSGPHAAQSGRIEGWRLTDHDLAEIDTRTNAAKYTGGLMNICMALAVHPRTGAVTVVGTDATNEVRFEPNLRGRFLRVRTARVAPRTRESTLHDLNPHLDYATDHVDAKSRRLSIGDPRAVTFTADGETGFVAGMGSNNVVVLDEFGVRSSDAPPIEVGEGPTGLVCDDARGKLYVLCKFEAAVSTIDLEKRIEIARVPFFDPTPIAVRSGRRHLYATHENSGLGDSACASCHVDARTDRLAWDLGDPSGGALGLEGRNLGANNPALNESEVPGRGRFEPFHPMKGPMTTQTLQDIVGHEPLHWRGDREGLEAFAGAFATLQGRGSELRASEVEELKAFLATISLPPNPYRDLDNGLSSDLPLAGHVSTGRFGRAGQPLPNGNARRGLERFRTAHLDNTKVQCVTCHTLPTGTGPDFVLEEDRYRPLAPGDRGERHHMLVSQDGSTNVSMKVPQLRTLYDKVGFDLSRSPSRLGFGFLHDGSVDTLARFVNEQSFSLESDADTADMIAFLLSFSGSDLPRGAVELLEEPPGTLSKDTHAAVGRQLTLAGPITAAQRAWLDLMCRQAASRRVGLVAKGLEHGRPCGWYLSGTGVWQADRECLGVSTEDLLDQAGRGSEVTFTVVVAGAERRIGVDRDDDGILDGDEDEWP